MNPAHFALALKSPSLLQQLPSDQSGFHLRMSFADFPKDPRRNPKDLP